jgi:hypothetical protein
VIVSGDRRKRILLQPCRAAAAHAFTIEGRAVDAADINAGR